jgi:16S rRNA (guanine527-N7)-methyltransferase
VTAFDFRARLAERVGLVSVELKPEQIEALEQYFELLLKWNRRINLTSLRLDPPTDEALDRLFVEPLAAAQFLRAQPPFATGNPRWFDLGSGGGSPAIPLKIAIPRFRLAMIESKSRKAAFLNETLRTLNLEGAEVLNARIERLLDRDGTADLVTIRAVRADPALELSSAGLLKDGAWLVAFRTTVAEAQSGVFRRLKVVDLGLERPSCLQIWARVPRGTTNR